MRPTMLAARVTVTGRKEGFPGNLTPFVTVTCIVAAMGGLIFGYNIGISGAVTAVPPSFREKSFPSAGCSEELVDSTMGGCHCLYDSRKLTMLTASVYLAAMLGSPVASTVTHKFGTRLSVLFGGILFSTGAIFSGFAEAIWIFIVGRVLLGLGLGFTSQSMSLYLSEMAPSKYRAKLGIGLQLSITVGILVANILNYFFAEIGSSWAWRLSLGGALVPALIITIGSLILPDTPSTMIKRGQKDEAREMLKEIRGTDDVDEEFDDLIAAFEAWRQVEHPWRNLLQRKYRPHLTMAILIPIFQQLASINVIMFYSPVIFNAIGFQKDATLMSAIVIGSVNVVATLVSIYGVDKWGRRFLFLEGGAQMLICQILSTICIAAKSGVDENPGDLTKWYAIAIVVFICVYVAGFTWSWGSLGFIVPSEIFPPEIRSAAQCVSISNNIMFTFEVAKVFLKMLCHLKLELFIFFSFIILAMSLFVYFFVPETKGKPIEEMGRVWETHWYWSRFVADVGGAPSGGLELGENVHAVNQV